MTDSTAAWQAIIASPAVPTSRRARLARCIIGIVVVSLTGLAAWWATDILVGSNLHTVIPGRVYRGAQPTGESLERIVRRHGIRTIVNLRGCGSPLPWYQAEGQCAQRLEISLEDVSFSAIHLPPPSELRQLVDVLDRSEYPIFLHCRHGSDRTGLAAAVVLLLEPGVDYGQARRELGIQYGHLAIGRTGYLDRFFDLYEDWLAESGQEHAPTLFRHWVLDVYRGGWCEGGVERVEPATPAKAGLPIGFQVRLHNRSKAVWHLMPTVTAGVHVFYRIWDAAGLVVREGRAGMLEASVGPGEHFDVTMVVPPLAAGRYWMSVDLIEEFHCWFYQAGAEPWEEELVVRE